MAAECTAHRSGRQAQRMVVSSAMAQSTYVGRPVARKEGRDKVTGAARYIDDLSFPGVIHGTTVRSPVARGRIRGIRFGDGIPWDEIVVVTAKDIPGENHVALILH